MENSGGGIGLLGFLILLFVGLKLTDFIDWSRLWVLSPTLIPLLIAALCGVFILLLSLKQTKF